jgi:hypothetical protein
MDESKTITKEALVFMVNKSEEATQTETVNFTELYRRNAPPVFY